MTPDAWVLRIHRQHDRVRTEERKLTETIAKARSAGCSWSLVALAMGTTKQNAHSMWKPKLERLEAVDA